MIEVEPTELPALQRQVADERAASKRWHDTYPMHGTEGCADTSDSKPRRRMPEGGLICLLLACAAVAGCWALAVYAPR